VKVVHSLSRFLQAVFLGSSNALVRSNLDTARISASTRSRDPPTKFHLHLTESSMFHREENALLVKMRTDVSTRSANRDLRAVRMFLDWEPACIRQLFTSVHADRYGFRCTRKGTRKIFGFALSIHLCPERTLFRISLAGPEARQWGKNGRIMLAFVSRFTRYVSQ